MRFSREGSDVLKGKGRFLTLKVFGTTKRRVTEQDQD
jgi:hypothetical protein